jgi:hypothetical protein
MENTQPRLVGTVRTFNTVRKIYPAYCRNLFGQKFDLVGQQVLKHQPALLEPPSGIEVKSKGKIISVLKHHDVGRAIAQAVSLVCVLCLIVLPLPPGENPFAVKINNNNNSRWLPTAAARVQNRV